MQAVQSLGQEDPLEKEIATHSSFLAWEIPWKEETGGLQSMRSQSQTGLKQLNTHVCGEHEGLLLLYGLESNPESSLQTPQEA